MTTDWIKDSERRPKQSGYYMTVCVDDRTKERFRSTTEFIKGYGWATFAALVTHWMDFPELPEEVTEDD